MIVRICDVVDQFLQKPFLFFSKNFHNFRFDVIEKQSIIHPSHYRSKSYAYVVLGDSEVTFLSEGEATIRENLIHNCLHFQTDGV